MLHPLPIHGTTQFIAVRGARPGAPVLLWLAGGPGAPALAWLRVAGAPLERHAAVVAWDEPGAGKSWRAGRARGATLDARAEDAGAVLAHVAAAAPGGRVLLAGHSWGSALGALVAARWPERVRAYLGVAQVVHAAEGDRAAWARTIDAARAAGDEDTARRLERLGPPPYRGAPAMERWGILADAQRRHGGSEAGRARLAAVARAIAGARGAPEYGWRERWRAPRAQRDAFARLQPQLAALDLHAAVSRLAVPVWLVHGTRDLVVPPEPAAAWLDALDAPEKRWVALDGVGHDPLVEAPDAMTDVVGALLAATSP